MSLAGGTIFLAGLLTFLSPCVLPLIPIYLSVLLGGSVDTINQEGKKGPRWKLMLNGAAFVLGFTLVFIALGMTASALGRFLATHRLLFQQIGGLLVFLFGLKFLGWLHIDLLNREKRFNMRRTGTISPLGAGLMGLTFGFGWTPCIGPVLGAILTYTATQTDSPSQGAWLLFLYAMGLGLPLLTVAALAQPGIRILNRIKQHIPKLEKATGLVLVVMAVLMVTDSTSLLTLDASLDSNKEISSKVVSELDVRRKGPDFQAAVARRLAERQAPTRDHSGSAEMEGAEEGMCGEDSGCGFDPGQVSGSRDFILPRGPAILDFYKPNCPACLKMAPMLDTPEHACSEKGMAIYRMDVTLPEYREVAGQLGVIGTPTLVFIDQDGREVSRLIGATTYDTLTESLAILMGEECRDFSRLDG